MTLIQSNVDESLTGESFAKRCIIVPTGKYYGLTQKLIKHTRERFQSGALTYKEAMWYLDYTYNDNLMLCADGDRDE